MHANTEFDQLATTLVWATCASGWGDATIDPDSRKRLEADYEAFCDLLPEEFDPEEACLTGGDAYEQFAHDYVLTRLGAGAGFWEAADWVAEDGEHLTAFCDLQGTLESYEEDGVVYVY